MVILVVVALVVAVALCKVCSGVISAIICVAIIPICCDLLTDTPKALCTICNGDPQKWTELEVRLVDHWLYGLGWFCKSCGKFHILGLKARR